MSICLVITLMITIYNDHGEHGFFLTMALNVLVGKSEIQRHVPIFDFWRNKEWQHLDFRSNPKFRGIEENLNGGIWLVKDKPMLWAYNVCTRGVISRERFFAHYKKGIDIQEFEMHPWRWAPICDLLKDSPYLSIKKQGDGTANYRSLRRWYRNHLLNEYMLQRKTPKNCLPFPISCFHNKVEFINQLQKVEKYSNKNFNYDKVNPLYEALHNTLSYTDQSAHNNTTQLLKVFKTLDIDYIR